MADLIDREKIRRELTGTLDALVDETLDAAGRAGCVLEGVVLFGSVVGKNYVPGRSDVNLFMVFDVVNHELLNRLRRVFNAHTKKLRTRPVVVHSGFIAEAGKLFPMEFLEWRERSSVIYGRNPFKEVEVPVENLGRHVEEALRGKRLRLMQEYLRLDGGRDGLQEMLTNMVPDLLVVLRNTLRLMGAAHNRDATGLIDAVEKKAGVSLVSFRRLYNIKTDGVRIGRRELELLFRGCLENMDELAEYVSGLERS